MPELLVESESPVLDRPIPVRTLGVKKKKMESLVDQSANFFFFDFFCHFL